MEAVHGVTIEEVQSALQHNDWNSVRAEQQLKVRLKNDRQAKTTKIRWKHKVNKEKDA